MAQAIGSSGLCGRRGDEATTQEQKTADLTAPPSSCILSRMGASNNSRRWIKRLLLSAAALILTLVATEIVLRSVDRPHFRKAHTETRRFLVLDKHVNGQPIYVNYPGRITFTYDGNPRGYFGPDGTIVHEVNADGFRGAPFTEKAEGTTRLLFLGDSFTFGEGVKLPHTYPEVTAGYLRASGTRAEACNLGVGGYNTTDSLALLKAIGLGLKPDAVILGYTLNDAEPPLFNFNSPSGTPIRRDREAEVEAEGAPLKPPSSPLYRLRIAQLIWRSVQRARLSRQTLGHYRSLFQQDSATWQENQRALRDIIGICHSNALPCVVVTFPILHKLSDAYPLAAIHEQVGSEVRDAGGSFVDLLPALKGKKAEDLWVHPTDQHPNERVHAIAGQKVAEALRKKRTTN